MTRRADLRVPLRGTDRRTPIDRLLAEAVAQLIAMPQPRLALEPVAERAKVPIDEARALFPSDDALLKMVAEVTMNGQFDAITRAVLAQPSDNPAAQFLALGHGFLDWAVTHPAEFRLLQSPVMVTALGYERLHRYNQAIRDIGETMLNRAVESGQVIGTLDVGSFMIAARGACYGIARLMIDDQLKVWGRAGETLGPPVLHDALSVLADGMFCDWRRGFVKVASHAGTT